MNQENLDNHSPKKRRIAKQKIKGWDRFRYLTLTAFMLTISLTFFSSAWLSVGHSFEYSSTDMNQEFILAQEGEAEGEREESAEEESAEEESEREESAEEEEFESEESSEEEESESEESAEEGESESEESAEEGESESEESAEEGESESEESAEEGESGSGEQKLRSVKKTTFEKNIEALEEEIDERIEEWESAKDKSQVSYSISAVATIVMTVLMVFLGIEIIDIPFRRALILILGLITVFIELNMNVFLLDKSLGGYEILSAQSQILQEKLEEVETEREFDEVREQFQELVLESLSIE